MQEKNDKNVLGGELALHCHYPNLVFIAMVIAARARRIRVAT